MVELPEGTMKKAQDARARAAALHQILESLTAKADRIVDALDAIDDRAVLVVIRDIQALASGLSEAEKEIRNLDTHAAELIRLYCTHLTL